MTRARRAACCTLIVAVAAVCLAGAPALFAAPSELLMVAARTPAPVVQGSAAAPTVDVSVDASASSVPIDGEFGYRATVRLKKPADFVQARMQLRMPGGSLIYQKTFVASSNEPTSLVFSFGRKIGDIGLEPAAYPYELTVRTEGPGEGSSLVVPGQLLVYDPAAPPVPVVAAARISAQPLLTPDGSFSADPGRFTRARDEVVRLCDYVLQTPDARLTLALSPVMLEEWRRISTGYRYDTPEGTVQVTAEEPVPQAYDQALARVHTATETGRLEIEWLAFSDPDISALAAAGLLSDVEAQYRSGSSATFAAIEATPAAGTAPAGGSLPPTAVTPLAKAGMRYSFVSNQWARVKKARPRPGVYGVQGSRMKALVADPAAERSLVASGPATVVSAAFTRLEASATPYPLLVTVGPGGATAEQFLGAVSELQAQPWARLQLAGDASAVTPLGTVRLLQRPADKHAPADYWTTVRHSRDWANALVSAAGPRSRESVLAQENSLIAEASAWSGIAGDWAPAERGLSFARDAEKTARAILERVVVSGKPVTLAGTSGDIPISVTNRSGRPLKVTLVFSPSAGVHLPLGYRRKVVLRSAENLVEVPVRMRGTLEGDLNVSVVSAGMELTSSTIKLKASYIDRLVLLGAIVVILGGLLVFIIARVKAAERADAEPRL